jgi:tripartite-type tricarboxylate transporter receptor subunit TctC
VRALASYSSKRSEGLPDVPTLKELGYDVEFYLWVGLFAPKGTPDAVVAKLRAETKTAANSDTFKTAIKNIGDEFAYLDGPDFQKFWDEDARRVEDAVHTIGRIQG